MYVYAVRIIQISRLLKVAPVSSYYANKVDLGDIYVPDVTVHEDDTMTAKIYSNTVIMYVEVEINLVP